MTAKFFLIAGSINAALAVLLGAFAAHGLKNRLSDYSLNVFNTATEYHFYHALGLLIVGIIMHLGISTKPAGISGLLMLIGIMLFSGSLYLLALTGIKWLGAITPLGGIAFISGWIFLAIAFSKI